ncbi:MAG: hypothetical protein JW784_06010, partial [Candidatus Cloacimonetes bacterium]|nr:hypothetical protein [Candidatus Cloacimonadota bacterium]
MRKCVLSALILLIVNGLFSAVNILDNSNGIILEYQRSENQEEMTVLKQVLAIPALEVKARIISGMVREYSTAGEYLGERDVRNEDMVVINSFVMRELYAHEVVIQLEEDLGDGKAVLQDLRLELINQQPVAGIETVSSVFRPVYQAMVDNFAQSYLYDLPVCPPSMLIITPASAVSLLDSFVEWKNALGITTAIATLDQTGNTSTSIKNYIQAIYDDQSATPPDYLLLIGDVNGAYALPSFYYSVENNVSDHPYTMLAGDDYLPEMIVGRLTVDTQFELMTVINKILFYEKNPYLEDSSWLTRALLVAGNYASTPPIPTTPTAVSQWLHEKMTDFGYTQVDEVFYPPTYPGTSAIINSINNGVGFVSYRGWGDANGWHYPNFKREDVQNL